MAQNPTLQSDLCGVKQEKMAVLEVCLMLELKDMSSSKMAPRFLTVVVDTKAKPSHVTTSLAHLFLRFLGPQPLTWCFPHLRVHHLKLTNVVLCVIVVWLTRVNLWMYNFSKARHLIMFHFGKAVEWSATPSGRLWYTGPVFGLISAGMNIPAVACCDEVFTKDCLYKRRLYIYQFVAVRKPRNEAKLEAEAVLINCAVGFMKVIFYM